MVLSAVATVALKISSSPKQVRAYIGREGLYQIHWIQMSTRVEKDETRCVLGETWVRGTNSDGMFGVVIRFVSSVLRAKYS